MGVFRQLRNRNTRLLMSAQLISELGSVMQTFALSLYVYAKTESGVAFASVLAVSVLPRLFGPFFGVMTDRINRKRLMVVLDISAAAVTLGFAAWHHFIQPLPLACVYCFVILLSAVQTFYDPTNNAIIPELVEESQLKDTNILASMVSSTALILGPLAASAPWLDPSSDNGILIIMLVNSCSYLCAATIESRLKNKSALDAAHHAMESFMDAMKTGINTIFGNRELVMIVVLSIIANFALYPVFSVGVSIVMYKDVGVTNELFGLSRSILYIGPIAGSLVANMLMKRLDYRRLLTQVFFIDGLLLLVMAATLLFTIADAEHRILTQFLLINLTALCIVATIVVASIAVTTAMQRIVPGHLMGRVMGVDASLCMLAIPFGQMLFSLVSDKLGSGIALVIFSFVAFLAGVVGYWQYKPMLPPHHCTGAGQGQDASTGG